MKGKTGTSEHKKRSEKSLRQVVINKRLCADHFKREQVLEGMRQAWKDPEVKAFRIERMKLGWQRKKQQRVMPLEKG